jgi:hypothetical protein
MLNASERFGLLVQILDPVDYRFLRSINMTAERAFRRDRVRIFRRELRVIAADSFKLYRERSANLAAAGRWQAYAPLVAQTGIGFLAIARLWTAGSLFAWRLPMVINAARNADQLVRFVTSEKFSSAPQRLPA